MAIIRCSCGFFYDEEKYGACTKCSGAYRAMRPVKSVLTPEAFFYEGKQDFFAGWRVWVEGGQKGRGLTSFRGV